MTSDASRRKKVAIIGCGYVGSALGEALVLAGHEVIGTTTSPSRVAEIEARGITGKVLEHADVERMHDVLLDRDAAYLCIAAGRQADYRSVYLDGARNFLKALLSTSVRRVVYTSSTSVYSRQDGDWVDEDSPTEPTSERGGILLQTERELLRAVDATQRDVPLSVTVLRLSGIHGPGRDPAARIETLADTERSDGEAYVNLVHRDDVVAALVKLLDVAYDGVLNLSDDQPLTRREWYDRVVAAKQLPPIRWVTPPGEIDRAKRIRNELLKKTLGLELKYPAH